MSHIVQIKTQIKDEMAVRTACHRLALPEPTRGTFKLFTQEASGLGVRLPDWRYPVVCNTESGEVQFDNYEGRWGEPQRLDQFLQAYAVENSSYSQCPCFNGRFC
jgi:hypothetical protein